MKLLLTLTTIFIQFALFGQFNDSIQLQNIENNGTAEEGNLYLDTIKKDYRIGLTHGKLGKLTDDQKLSLDTVNQIIRLENGDSVDLNKVITGPRFYAGKFQITSSGSITVTGLPFKPSSITFTAYANIETDSLDTDNGIGNNSNTISNSFNFMKGFAQDNSGTTIQQVICGGGSGSSINDISRYASPLHCIGIRYANNNGDKVGITSATLTSFNSNGFTLDVDSFADGILVIFEAHR